MPGVQRVVGAIHELSRPKRERIGVDHPSLTGGRDRHVPLRKRLEGHACRARRKRIHDPILESGPDKLVPPNEYGRDKHVPPG